MGVADEFVYPGHTVRLASGLIGEMRLKVESKPNGKNDAVEAVKVIQGGLSLSGSSRCHSKPQGATRDRSAHEAPGLVGARSGFSLAWGARD